MRYARQEALASIGVDGQKRLSESKIVIIGSGALGSVASDLLARAGVGKITIIDQDIVDLTNLQRQSLYSEEDINRPKASTAKSTLSKVNSAIKLVAHDENLNSENIERLIGSPDCVLDCTDNLDTRFLLNEYARKNNIPWVHAAAIQEKGTVLAITPGGPCFRCVFPKATQGASCEDAGVLNAASHLIASLQVSEAFKILLDKPSEEMLRVNLKDNSFDKIKVNKHEGCTVCNGTFELLESKEESIETDDFSLRRCKTRAGFSAQPVKNTKLDLESIKREFEVVIDTPILLVIGTEAGKTIVHSYGELLFKECEDVELMKKVAEKIYQYRK